MNDDDSDEEADARLSNADDDALMDTGAPERSANGDQSLNHSSRQVKPKSLKQRDLEPPKKKRKTAPNKSDKPSLPVFDLEEPVFTSSKSSRSNFDSGLADPYGEVTSLQFADAADKTARRKTLRFHTSKIESTSLRRQGARNNAMGGDDDLPYMERRKRGEAKLVKEVRGQGGQDLNDVDPDTGGERNVGGDTSDSDDDEEGPDGYYDQVKRQSKEKRQQKKALYEAEHFVR